MHAPPNYPGSLYNPGGPYSSNFFNPVSNFAQMKHNNNKKQNEQKFKTASPIGIPITKTT